MCAADRFLLEETDSERAKRTEKAEIVRTEADRHKMFTKHGVCPPVFPPKPPEQANIPQLVGLS